MHLVDIGLPLAPQARSRSGPRPSFFPSFFRIVFFHMFAGIFRILAPFWGSFGMICHVFRITFSSMKFVSFFHRFGDGFWPHCWCLFDEFSGSRTHLAKPRILNTFQSETCFYTSEKHDFSWFSSSFSLPVFAWIFDAFWHWFHLHFGSLLASNFMFFREWFFHDFLDGIFLDFYGFLTKTGSQK